MSSCFSGKPLHWLSFLEAAVVAADTLLEAFSSAIPAVASGATPRRHPHSLSVWSAPPWTEPSQCAASERVHPHRGSASWQLLAAPVVPRQGFLGSLGSPPLPPAKTSSRGTMAPPDAMLMQSHRKHVVLLRFAKCKRWSVANATLNKRRSIHMKNAWSATTCYNLSKWSRLNNSRLQLKERLGSLSLPKCLFP